jgi:hypothetical protein
MYFGLAPLAELVGSRRQGLEGRPLELLESSAAVALDLLERTAVESLDESGNGAVQLADREERLVTKTRQDPALDHQHAGLDLGLVAGFTCTRGQHRELIVLGKILVRPVDVRIVAVGFGDAALEVIRDDRPRCTTKILKRAHVRTEPIPGPLAQRSLGVGVVGKSQHGDEDLRRSGRSRVPVLDRHRLTRIIDEQLVAGRVFLAQHELSGGKPAAVLIAEHAVLPAVRMSVLVLLPEQQSRDAAAAKLGVQVGKIRTRRARQWNDTPIHLGVQCRFIHRRRQRPCDTGIARTAHALLHGGTRAANRSGYLSVTEAFGLEPQDLPNLAHG